jgi:hypothetical protein
MATIKKLGIPKKLRATIYPSFYVFTLLPTTVSKSFLSDVLKVFESLSLPKNEKQMLILLDKQIKENELFLKFKYLWEKGIQDYTKTIGGASGVLAEGDKYQKASFIINFISQRREIEICISTAGTITQEIRIDQSMKDDPHLLENIFQSLLKHSWTTIKDRLVEMPGLSYLSVLLKEREYFPIGYSVRSPEDAFEDAILKFLSVISRALEAAKAEKDTQSIIMLKSLMNLYSRRIDQVASERNMKIPYDVLREWELKKFETEYESENTASSALTGVEQTLQKILFELDGSLE